MTLYKATCAYRDLDGEIYMDSKTVEADNKQAAKNILDNYFYDRYDYLSRDWLLFSTVKEVSSSHRVVASGAGSVAIGGAANNVVIQTGKYNTSVQSLGANIGDVYY